jgi:hypothetical protein
MSSTKSKCFAASRGTAALVLAGMLVLGFGLTDMARAQDSGSQNGLEGTWRLQVTVRDCNTGQPLRPTFPGLFAVAKGGTATIIIPGANHPPSSRRKRGSGGTHRGTITAR